MKIQIFSDLHVDVSPPPAITIGGDVDLVLIAGDTAQGAHNSFVALRRIVPEKTQIAMVMGNHDFYRRCLPEELREARELAPSYNVTLLERDSVPLGGGAVRVAGCSLWTDYQVFGANNAGPAMRVARDGLNDHRLITLAQETVAALPPSGGAAGARRVEEIPDRDLGGPVRGIDDFGRTSRHWRSAHPQYQTDILTAAFVSRPLIWR